MAKKIKTFWMLPCDYNSGLADYGYKLAFRTRRAAKKFCKSGEECGGKGCKYKLGKIVKFERAE